MVISKERKFMVPWCVDHMLPTISSFFKFLILCSSLLYICSSASDSIMFNNSISDERGETLVSANGTFELGFFTPNESSRRYVGIWYYNFTQQTVVWVANRDSPLSDRSGSFGVTEDGNLKVLDGKGNAIWYTKLESNTSSNTTAKLLDSGNLVLSNETSAAAAEIVWESFRNPTDTFLPGMIMDASLNLISWKTSDNPAQGSFIFKKDQDTEDQFKVWKDTMIQYWTSETDPTMPSSLLRVLSNNTMASCGRIARGSPYTPCHPPTNSKSPYASRNNPYYDYSNKRVVMSSTGEIRYLSWDANKIWSLIWRAPKDQCGALDFCGKFGSCNINNPVLCKCLPGFHPSSPDYWESGKFSGGCFRKSQICSKKDENETFLSLKMMKVRDANAQIGAGNETECRNKCLDNCNCQAYSYDNSSTVVPAVCLIWTEDLTDLQEEYGYSGSRSVSVRVYPSDIASINRSCMTCGTNIIPYPLSTDPTCGDPLYSYFHCDNSTGQLSFEAPGGGTYKVTGINPNTQIFVIQTPNNIEDYCDAKSPRGQFLQLDKTLSFYVNSSCTVRSDKKKSKGRDELEISWYPPSLPPTCNSSIDCGPHSTCKEKGGGIKRCLCNDNFQWNNSSMNCTQLVSEGSPEPPVKPLEQPSSYKFSRSLIIGIAISSVVVVIALSCAIVYISYLWKRRLAQRQEKMDSIQRNQALYGSERHVRNLIDSGDFREEDKKGIDVPFFDLESILGATDNFSDANKLGQGGFGSVYKGTLPGGREIAVKRLSSVSLQGLGEFKNEVVLIAKLQHRNLVRLLGYCIKGEEKILLYEYMPNKSLDSFIFDRTLCTVLNWELRFNIILGIARGLLYLHQDSRLRIIHRDLKTSNILLDEEMNPKISDFGLARIFEGKQIEGTTNRVVGTYGYMSPEYALDGLFSIKSDVFSFGVVVLEIISGRRNTGFYQSKITLSLLGYAWKLWNEDQALGLMHETLRETCNTNEFLRCLNVGLLCVQEDVNDRPTMSNVVFMLGSETTTLPTPKQPAFIVRRDPSTTASSSTIPETSSNSAIVEGR